MSEPLLHLDEVSYTYPSPGQPLLLKAVSLHLDGATLAVVRGASGAGKSTLLAIAGLLISPDSGRVLLEGTCAPTTQSRRSALRTHRIGMILQTPHLLGRLSVLDNLRLGAPGSDSQHLRDCLAELGIAAKEAAPAAALSGGEAQRASVARALAKRPRLILADEPTSQLDGDAAALVVDALEARVRAGTSVLAVSHDVRLMRAATHDLVLHEGTLAPGSATP